MFMRQSQAGKSAAVKVHPYFTFTLSSSWILSGSVRFCQILSGSVRFCQVLSGFFRFDGYLNVYEAEPSWQVSSSQGQSIKCVYFGFTLRLLRVYLGFTLGLLWFTLGSCWGLLGFFRFDGFLNVYEAEPSWQDSSSQGPSLN